MNDKHHKKIYPMNIVARRTGLTTHVIRVWEKRYGAVTPERTPTNRRLYSEADIERLRLLRLAGEQGHSIGQVATMPSEVLGELLARELARPASGGNGGDLLRRTQGRGSETGAPEAEELLGLALEAIERLDAGGLEHALGRASLALSRPALIEQVIAPLLQAVGEGWEHGTLRVAHEHMTTAVARTFLANLMGAYAAPQGSPLLVAATPAGQLHELGALTAAVTAAAEGWRVLYLGPSLPAEEIALAAQTHGARAVALSLVYPPDDPLTPGELTRLGRLLGGQTALLVGGQAAAAYRRLVEEAGGVLLADLAQLREKLRELRQGGDLG